MNTVLDPPITSSCSKSLLFFPSFLPALNITRPIPLSSLTSQFEPRSPIQTLLLCSRRHHQVERHFILWRRAIMSQINRYYTCASSLPHEQSSLLICQIFLLPNTRSSVRKPQPLDVQINCVTCNSVRGDFGHNWLWTTSSGGNVKNFRSRKQRKL